MMHGKYSQVNHDVAFVVYANRTIDQKMWSETYTYVGLQKIFHAYLLNQNQIQLRYLSKEGVLFLCNNEYTNSTTFII